MARPQRRSANYDYILYKPKAEVTPCGYAVHGRTSKERGDKLVMAGAAVEIFDQLGNHYAYQLLDQPQKPSVHNGGADAPPTAVLLTVREMDLIAGQAFRNGRSRTARMSEMQRLSRVHPLTRKALPPEDAIERAAEKFRLLTPIRGSAPKRMAV